MANAGQGARHKEDAADQGKLGHVSAAGEDNFGSNELPNLQTLLSCDSVIVHFPPY